LLNRWTNGGEATRNSEPEGKLRWSLLSATLFPVGKAFWWEQTPRRQNVVPYAVHGNWVVGFAIKRYRFKETGLWFLEEPAFYYKGTTYIQLSPLPTHYIYR